MMENYVEVWQRGAIPNVPPLLQPVAHALLQVGEEAHRIMQEFPDELLWKRPGNVAPPAFHLQHIRGVIDRLFTYEIKELLTKEQMDALLIEGKEEKNSSYAKELIEKLDKQIDDAIKELISVKEDTLGETRGVGRKQIPTTLIGLYFHAAEHSMRHIGQLLVTVRILKATQ
jgi:uncharacterized damage-inducible protein DinB